MSLETVLSGGTRSMKTEFHAGPIGIRPYRQEDIPALFEAVQESKAELGAWMAWCHPDYSLKDSQEFVQGCPASWEKGEHYSFVIQESGGGRLLGGVGISFINRAHGFANLGYWVRTRATGRGHASAATRLLARFGFEEFKFHRLEIVAAMGNRPSQRVAEKAGARREGVLRKRLVLQGRPQDAVMYSLVAEDLEPTRPSA